MEVHRFHMDGDKAGILGMIVHDILLIIFKSSSIHFQLALLYVYD